MFPSRIKIKQERGETRNLRTLGAVGTMDYEKVDQNSSVGRAAGVLHRRFSVLEKHSTRYWSLRPSSS